MFWKDKPLFYKIFLILSFIFLGFGIGLIILESIFCLINVCEWGLFASIVFGLPAMGIGLLFFFINLFLLWIRNKNSFFGKSIIIFFLLFFSYFFIISSLGILEIYPYAAWRIFGTNYNILIEYWAQIIIELFLIILTFIACKKSD